MISALLTAICWSISGFASSRISRFFGAPTANLLRLCIATLLLFSICLWQNTGFTSTAAIWFVLAGLCHLCIGDMGLFAAFRRLGPRLSVLMVGSLAPPTALLSEWWILGDFPSLSQIICAGSILLLVAVAVAPKERQHLSPQELRAGLLFGVIAAVGQGLSSTLQRYGNYQTTLSQTSVDPWLMILIRVGAGTLGVMVILLFLQLAHQHPFRKPVELIPHRKVEGHPLLWLGISALMGPIIGMSFLITALETTSSGLVQAVIATMPVFMIPVAWILDGNAPSIRSIIAGSAAVSLTALLIFL
ncbi:DMT family transporter [Kiritimatiellota bacterium B12222]|nr:DMT family transporter [Kiritimatiellota bacterium B12222]